MNKEANLNETPYLTPEQKSRFKDEHIIDLPLYLIATIFTCGIFNLYWNYRQMQSCNALLKEEEFEFAKWLLLSIITCGIYHIYYQYQMGSAIMEIQQRMGLRVKENLSVLSAIVSVLGLSIVVDCIHQDEINKILKS